MWSNTGLQRPDFAIAPGPGQESVWDYPRPPAIKRDWRLVEVADGDNTIARTRDAYRVLETASPPAFYLPPESVLWEHLVEVDDTSVCEWKGMAKYWALARDPETPVAWAYPRPKPRFDVVKIGTGIGIGHRAAHYQVGATGAQMRGKQVNHTPIMPRNP